MIKEHDCIVLTTNVPDEDLESGDIGTVVHIHKDGEAYEVEFMTLIGETVAIVTLLAGHVRPLNRRDLAHGLPLAHAVEALRGGGRGIGQDAERAIAWDSGQAAPVCGRQRVLVFEHVLRAA